MGSNIEQHRPVVLVVDDESVIADTLAAILNQSGYIAIVAYDGEAGIEMALIHPPELLVTDVMLPGMNGIELAVTIRRIFPECKVLLFSGHATTSDLMMTSAIGGNQFELLTKPLHPTELIKYVETIFKQSQSS
ncbi:MAG TPA: response regulator [Terracidiphilus sp.]|jgi:DNA-binding response OmpR family regulator